MLFHGEVLVVAGSPFQNSPNTNKEFWVLRQLHCHDSTRQDDSDTLVKCRK